MRTNGQGKDSRIALYVADKLRGISFVHQFGMGTNPIQNGPEGPFPVAKEHGELGILQTFDPSSPNVLMGGGVPSGGATMSLPNTNGFAYNGLSPLLGDVRGINGV